MRAALGDAINSLDCDQVLFDDVHHPVAANPQTVIIASVEGICRIGVGDQSRDSKADAAHPILIFHVPPRRSSSSRRPLDLHWSSSSAIASSCETAPGLPAVTHSR